MIIGVFLATPYHKTYSALAAFEKISWPREANQWDLYPFPNPPRKCYGALSHLRSTK